MEQGACGKRRGSRGPRSEPDRHGLSAPLASSPAPLASWNTTGLTLVEMILVLFLVGLVMAVALPRIGSADPMKLAARQLVASVQLAQAVAVSIDKAFRFYFDLDQQAYWVVTLEGGEERVPADARLSQRVELPREIRFMEVTTSNQGKKTSGRASIVIQPTGRPDLAAITLIDPDRDTLAVMTDPATGTVRAAAPRTEPKLPEPLPDRLRALLRPLTPQAPGPTAGTL